ncbi:hypothetical protein FQN54_006351 [Arachnomyces sp. PD_36]|nr:hypothetical protein FQN54_006351 [Arachnomyces sp. PD_36]
MKSLPFLFLFTHLCASVAVPLEGRAPTATLHIRADDDEGDPMDTDAPGQQLINPDDEVSVKDQLTLAETQKSQILKFDTPQEQTDNRWFDWDESCADENDRKKVLLAFEYGYHYAEKASSFLQTLSDGLPKPAGSSAIKDNVKYIVETDPAFTQMFFAQDNRVLQVKGTFDNLLAKMKSYDGRNTKRENANGVRFVCDREDEVRNVDGDSWCGTGDGAAQAVTYNAVDHGYIEPKYDFDHSASIVFCPAFFDEEKFPNADVIAGDNDNPKTLDRVDSRERIMIHEWLHLEFTSNLPSNPDEIGFEKSAKVAGKGSGKSRKADWANGSKNCDSYAWYALYAFWNNEGSECGRDAWPSGVKKPNSPA